MDNAQVIFWIICLNCIIGIATRLRAGRSGAGSSNVILPLVLLVAGTGRLLKWDTAVYASAGLWALFVLVPGLLGRLFQKRFQQQNFGAAGKLAVIISWLHPFDGWRQVPELVRALELAHRGELDEAAIILKRFQGVESTTGLAAMVNLYRITNQWEELLKWEAQLGNDSIARNPTLIPALLRARGETGDVRGMVEFYERHRERIGRLIPAASRDLCRLPLFAFGGNRQMTEQLFVGSLATLPEPTRKFWLATADLYAGATESAKSQLESLLPAADPTLRRSIERRLFGLAVAPQTPLEEVEKVVANAAVEHGHDERFGARRSLFSKQARATQILIGLNVAMFVAEICLGGGSDPEAIYRLGAMYAPAVREGEWWRLVASLFLHLGPVHITMNMLGLWVLGPFVEFALGFRRYLFVYLLCGVGSMGVVGALAPGVDQAQITVGASGCIMGLVGASAALMLRGWRREKAQTAKRRLIGMVSIVAIQCVFDANIPQVSGTAHLSGAAIGFLVTLFLRDRLKAPERGAG